jgi:nucleoside-diphosphate-sugar epimerase
MSSATKRVVVIGGSGHIGSYLIPRLVHSGHKVVNVSRGQRKPYVESAAWQDVEQVVSDRTAEESLGHFGQRILALKPDVVIDITCYTLENAHQLVEALQGSVHHFLHCGTIWVHGPSEHIPTTEDQPRNPCEEYGRRKAAIEDYLLSIMRQQRFPVTILHPGHLVGTGWAPINPVGNFNTDIFSHLARNEEVFLPNEGREFLHHVHADDVAQAFVESITHSHDAIGQSFHVVSPAALTLSEYAQAAARWFDREARLEFLPWEVWKQTASEKDAEITRRHLQHSSNCSIEKARELIGYEPRYTSLEATREAVFALIENGTIVI